jgi:hypothetical protein
MNESEYMMLMLILWFIGKYCRSFLSMKNVFYQYHQIEWISFDELKDLSFRLKINYFIWFMKKFLVYHIDNM